MVNRRDYSDDIVEAARSVQLEVLRILGEYKENIVIVGGWVPELLIPDAEEKHIGSSDVDLALNHRKISEAGYKTIKEHLLSHGYEEGEQPFTFKRSANIGEKEILVEVHFLAGEYAGSGHSHRTQKVLDMQPRKARGVDLAFEMPEKISIRGRLPEGGEDVAEIQVASVPSFLVMKGMALKERLKEKDAWDIYYCVQYYQGGVDELIKEFRPLLKHSLVKEALGNMAEKFSSPAAVGPTHIVDFEEIEDAAERALIQRDAYERINYFLAALGVDLNEIGTKSS